MSGEQPGSGAKCDFSSRLWVLHGKGWACCARVWCGQSCRLLGSGLQVLCHFRARSHESATLKLRKGDPHNFVYLPRLTEPVQVELGFTLMLMVLRPPSPAAGGPGPCPCCPEPCSHCLGLPGRMLKRRGIAEMWS